MGGGGRGCDCSGVPVSFAPGCWAIVVFRCTDTDEMNDRTPDLGLTVTAAILGEEMALRTWEVGRYGFRARRTVLVVPLLPVDLSQLGARLMALPSRARQGWL